MLTARSRRAAASAVLTLSVAACSVAACSSGGPGPGSSSGTPATSDASGGSAVGGAPTAVSPPSGVASTSRAASASASASSGGGGTGTAAAVFAAMSERQRVGQLLMVDCPSSGVADATVSAITDDAVGSVILDGTTTSGSTAIRAITSRLQGYAPPHAGLLVATDQEGGLVQRLQGPGFDTIPDAVQQGALSTSTLRADARTWGTQLIRAGVDVNLAPVLDTVPAGGGANPPIGDLDREYGRTPSTVLSHGLAYAQGMTDAGVAVTVKHFPGLGRVTGNTDTTSGVTDSVTTRTDADLAPFAAAVQAGVPFVMMSTAIYARIDPGTPAAFSSTIVTGMLRGDLGFRGLIISDDLGAARQVSSLSPGERAVRFVQAGGDVVLTVVADQAAAMTSALLARAQSDPAFKRQVDAAALLVLQTKQRAGLL